MPRISGGYYHKGQAISWACTSRRRGSVTPFLGDWLLRVGGRSQRLGAYCAVCGQKQLSAGPSKSSDTPGCHPGQEAKPFTYNSRHCPSCLLKGPAELCPVLRGTLSTAYQDS